MNKTFKVTGHRNPTPVVEVDGKPLESSRIMSWFTEETICFDCSTKEREIKQALRAKDIKNAMEGCGFIPQQGVHY